MSTRIWLDDIDLAFNRVGDNNIINIVTSSITGSLRKEVELYIREFMTACHVAREEVPWPEIREHVIKSFLNLDEVPRYVIPSIICNHRPLKLKRRSRGDFVIWLKRHIRSLETSINRASW